MGYPDASGDPTLPAAEGAAPGAGTRLGRYIVLYSIGRGGMGVVSAAYDPELDRNIAIKLVAGYGADARERLAREARALAKLAHENVVTIHDVGNVDGKLFIAMELVDGGDVAQWLARAPRSWREIVRVFAAAGRGLAASHAAGLVHGDVKPANVLVARGGRVLITDFGLARAIEQIAQRGAELAGTPAYMAPEQLAGEPADERSDQYSFCIALREALGDRAVPARIRRALARGTARDRAQRFGSMTELVHELAAPSRRGAWIVAAAVAAVPVLAAGGAYLAWSRGGGECTGGQPKIDELWNAPVQAQLAGAFAATRKPYAAAAWQQASAMVDRYTRGWVDMHVAACEASAGGDQPADVLDLRMTCLERRRAELRALLDVLAHPDGELVAKAATIVGRLDDVAGCADVAALRATVPPPADPALRANVAALYDRLARDSARGAAGDPGGALGDASQCVTAAHALGYQPLEAQARFVLGALQLGAGAMQPASDSLHAAIVLAEASGDQTIAAKAWSTLVSVEDNFAHYDDAVHAADHARAMLARLGGNRVAEAELASALGLALDHKGDYAAARTTTQQAIALFDKELPPDDPRTARAVVRLGMLEENQNHLDRAKPAFERAIATFERALGPAHPDLGRTLGELCRTERELGNLDAAERACKRSLAILESAFGDSHTLVLGTLVELANLASVRGNAEEAAKIYRRVIAAGEKLYGPEHPSVTGVMNNLALTEIDLHHLAAARELLVRCLAAEEKRVGPEHPLVASTLSSLLQVAVGEGKLDEARGYAERALAIRVKALGPEDLDVADSYRDLGWLASRAGDHARGVDALRKAQAILAREPPISQAATRADLAYELAAVGKLDEAEALFRAARDAFIATHGPEHGDVSYAEAGIALVLYKRGKLADAVPLAEHALAIRNSHDASPETLAETHDLVARLLWDAPPPHRDRARAGELARKALAGYTRRDPESRRRAGELARWMATRGIR
jgi:eukaryotic-like serine/threonine-protein kinase